VTSESLALPAPLHETVSPAAGLLRSPLALKDRSDYRLLELPNWRRPPPHVKPDRTAQRAFGRPPSNGSSWSSGAAAPRRRRSAPRRSDRATCYLGPGRHCWSADHRVDRHGHPNPRAWRLPVRAPPEAHHKSNSLLHRRFPRALKQCRLGPASADPRRDSCVSTFDLKQTAPCR
jgi:hypothetical protein